MKDLSISDNDFLNDIVDIVYDYFFRFANQTNILISFLYSLLLTRRIVISMRTIRILIAVSDLT